VNASRDPSAMEPAMIMGSDSHFGRRKIPPDSRGLVPAIGRGSLPLLMAGTRPAMTVRLVSFSAGRPLSAGGNSQ
jgi:hypothetical protein